MISLEGQLEFIEDVATPVSRKMSFNCYAITAIGQNTLLKVDVIISSPIGCLRRGEVGLSATDSLQLVCVPPECVSRMWPGPVHDMIDAGFAASDVPMPPDMLEQLRYGTRLLWLVVTDDSTIVAAMLTQLFEMRSGRICKMMECSGSRIDEWKDFRAQIERYARNEDCSRVMVEGRPGWSRILSDYRVVNVVLEKRI